MTVLPSLSAAPSSPSYVSNPLFVFVLSDRLNRPAHALKFSLRQQFCPSGLGTRLLFIDSKYYPKFQNTDSYLFLLLRFFLFLSLIRRTPSFRYFGYPSVSVRDCVMQHSLSFLVPVSEPSRRILPLPFRFCIAFFTLALSVYGFLSFDRLLFFSFFFWLSSINTAHPPLFA